MAMTSSDEVILAKRQLRAEIGEKRQAFIRLKGRVALAEVVRRTFEHFMKNIGFDGHEAMAGYWPMAQEFDSRSFLFKAVDHGLHGLTVCVHTGGQAH